MSLQLPVKSKTLTESLKEFVKGDWLEGDNAYKCEKCDEKVIPPPLSCHPLYVIMLEGHSKAYVCEGTTPSTDDPPEEIWI